MRLVALDLVRFFAAFAVVMYHYTARTDSNSFSSLAEITKFGYLGVPLFFIISGYVIALSARNRPPLEFAISRFVRLYPAYWAGIAITIFISVVYGANSYSVAQILANLTMLNDYIEYENIDGVYWTLQAELKFYVCIFLLLFLGVFNKFKVWLTIWLLLTALHTVTNQPFFMGWFISPSYSPYFIAGVAFYLIQKDGKNRFNLTVLFCSLILSSVCGFEQAVGFMPYPGLLNKSCSVAIIWLFYALFFSLVTKKIQLANRELYVTLGALTYPLYLIHNIAGKTIIDYSIGTLSEESAVIITIVIMLSLSYMIHIVVEKKLASPMKRKLIIMLRTISPQKNAARRIS